MATTKKRPITPIERKKVNEMFKEVGKLFGKIGGAINEKSLKRAHDITYKEGFPEIQRIASELYNEIDRYEGICSRDPGLYKRWQMAKQNLHLIATYKKL